MKDIDPTRRKAIIKDATETAAAGQGLAPDRILGSRFTKEDYLLWLETLQACYAAAKNNKDHPND